MMVIKLSEAIHLSLRDHKIQGRTMSLVDRWLDLL